MIHKYFMNGLYIILDVNSGAVHVTDKIVYDILSHYDGSDNYEEQLSKLCGALNGLYEASQIEEAFLEIRKLKDSGLLFSKDVNEGAAKGFDERIVKAMCLIVAQDCNLKCSYCFAGDGEYNAKSLMSLDTGKKAIDFLISNSGSRRNLEVDFFGGEPLLNFEVVKSVVEYAKTLESKYNKNFRFTITTNGLLLSEQIINYINENMYNVVLSLDGRREVNDKMRVRTGGQGSYDAIVPKIKSLVESRKGRSYYVRGTFTHYNLDFDKDVFHMEELGFNNVSIEPVVSSESEDYSIKKEDLEIIINNYEDLAKNLIKLKEKNPDFNFFHFTIDLEGGPCAKKLVSGCGAGSEYVAVTTDGTLYPCHQFASLPDGDANDFILGDVEKGITNLKLSRHFSNCGIYTKNECKNCFAKFYCGGGCAANAYSECKDIYKVYETGCILQRKRTECAIMMKAYESCKDMI